MKIQAVLLALLCASGAGTAVAGTQEALQKVKDLYAAAAYEDALAVVAALPEDTRSIEMEQYRAFCYIALGQRPQARDAIEALLTEDPLYEPDESETSPRVLATFNEVRLSVLPSVAKKLYGEAKEALERKNRKAAVEGFDTLLRLIDAVETEDETIADMRVLAEGFRDLSRALPDPEQPKATDAASALSTGAENATDDNAETTGGTNGAPVVAPAPVSWTRPVALKQEMPRWVAPDPISRRSEFAGILRVRVGADGRVRSAELVKRVHPMYDSLLIDATESWLYEPARQNGQPVPAEVLVEIRLRPQE